MVIESGCQPAEPTYHVPGLFTYRLKFKDDGEGPQKDVEFEAPDAATALMIAHREASDRWAELWKDGRKVCTIKRTKNGRLAGQVRPPG